MPFAFCILLQSLHQSLLLTTSCTMSGPKTTWEDLSNLGWFKQQVYNKLNAQRGGTMQGLGDMALNEGFATDYGYVTLHLRLKRQADALLHTSSWYCYNVLHGDPRIGGQSADNINSSTIVWSYDNTQNSKPFGPTQWTESWTNSETADLSISVHGMLRIMFAPMQTKLTNPAGISLSQSITIPFVGGSTFSIDISTTSTKTETKSSSRQLSNTWDITYLLSLSSGRSTIDTSKLKGWPS